MSLELDHIFCFCEPALSEVKVLEDAGFILTSGRKHQGQGTANRSVLFQSNYLELIYLDSQDEARSNPVRLDLRANWKTTGKSPFGIALRGEIPAQCKSQFWEYRPPYNTSMSIMMHQFNEVHPEFPLLFVMPPSTTQRASLLDKPHKTGSAQIKRVIIRTPCANWPLPTKVESLFIQESERHNIEVQLDGALPGVLQLNELLSLTTT